MVRIVGGKAFRPVKKCMDSGVRQHWHPVHRRFQNGFEVVEIFGKLIKFKAFGNARHAPWL